MEIIDGKERNPRVHHKETIERRACGLIENACMFGITGYRIEKNCIYFWVEDRHPFRGKSFIIDKNLAVKFFVETDLEHWKVRC